jgi:hypothetical protein
MTFPKREAINAAKKQAGAQYGLSVIDAWTSALTDDD